MVFEGKEQLVSVERSAALRGNFKPMWLAFWAAGLALLGSSPPALAQVTRLPPLGDLFFQTNGPCSPISDGDWYTAGGGAGAPAGCGPTNTTSTSPSHVFVFNISELDIQNGGGSVTIRILDAESALDPALPIARDPDQVLPVGSPVQDPTRFRLIDPAGTVLQEVVVPAGTANNFTITFPTITQPGAYRVTSETGAFSIFGNNTSDLNDDQNSFFLEVGVSQLLISQFQGTFERRNFSGTAPATATLDFFFLVGPGQNQLLLRNFDLDGQGSIVYTSPSTATTPGTISGGGEWNGPGGTRSINTSQDQVFINTTTGGLPDAGRWQFSLQSFPLTNQGILEVNAGSPPPQLDTRLPLLVEPPLRAGNFTITTDTTLTTTIDSTVCHPFQVVNRFFTTDIVNLSPTDPTNNTPLTLIQGAPQFIYRTSDGYEVQFRDSSGQTPLVDTDGDGNPDTGILTGNGGTGNFTLCVTPRAGAPASRDVRIDATSFMDFRIRVQQDGGPPPLPQSVLKTTQINAGTGNIGLTKRITRVFRAATGAVETYTTAGTSPALADFVGVTTPQPALLQAGDWVEYAVYYNNSSSALVTNLEICDPIPAGTRFVGDPTAVAAFQDLYSNGRGIALRTPGGLPLGNGGSISNVFDGDSGEFVSPLAPRASCPGENAGNQGAVVVRVGSVSPGEVGFVKFVTRVD